MICSLRGPAGHKCYPGLGSGGTQADRGAGAHLREATLSQLPDAVQTYRPMEPELPTLPAKPGAWILK